MGKNPAFIEQLFYDKGIRPDGYCMGQTSATGVTCSYIQAACELAVLHQGIKHACWEMSRLRKMPDIDPVFPEFVRCKLSLAAYLGGESAVVSLVARGADVNANDKWLGPPLNAAVFGGHSSIVSLLLSFKADPNIPGDLGTPLMIATWREDKPMMRLLLQNDEVKPNMTTFYSDKNAVFMACRSGDVDIARLLLGHKRISLKVRYYRPKSSPLEAALLSPEHDGMAELLLQRKDAPYTITDEVSFTAVNCEQTYILRLLLERLQGDAHNYRYMTRRMLHWAAETGRASAAKVLLQRPDISPNPPPGKDNYCTPLYLATANGHHAVVRLLLQRCDIKPNVKY